jgi:hypothetical protein
VAEHIYCVFEKGNASLAATKGKDKAQKITLDGNPATATIKKELRINKAYTKLP